MPHRHFPAIADTCAWRDGSGGLWFALRKRR
jgi:hypothetical protein